MTDFNSPTALVEVAENRIPSNRNPGLREYRISEGGTTLIAAGTGTYIVG